MEYFPGPHVCVHLDIPPEMGVGAGPGRAGVGKQMIIDYSAFFVFLHSSDSSGVKARKKDGVGLVPTGDGGTGIWDGDGIAYVPSTTKGYMWRMRGKW